MKKRNAKVFALFMSVAMAMPNVAAAMPVYAAPEFEDEADFGDKFEEEFEAEAEEEVEAEDTTNADEEIAEETEDVEVVTVARGTCGVNNSENEKITWELDSDGTLAIHATGAEQHMIDYGKDNAPWKKEDVKHIVVSGDIYNLGTYAFYGCENLEDAELSYTIKKIGNFAFAECPSLTKVTYDEPAKVRVEEYGFASFMNDTALQQMDISQRVKVIKDFTFYNCVKFVPSNMETLPNTLTEIGDAAFWNCQSITKVVIPYSVERIGGGYSGKASRDTITSLTAYEDTSTKKYVKAPTSSTYEWAEKVYGSTDEATNDDGIIDKWGAFTGCTGLTSVKFVNSMIEDEYGNVNLEGVRFIEDFAFYGCTSLGSVTLPGSMVEMGDFTFADCTGMTDAVIEDSWMQYLYGTFEECTSLTKVVFGTYTDVNPLDDTDIRDEKGYWCGIRQIGNRSFNGCSSLTDVVLSKDLFNYRWQVLGIPYHADNRTDAHETVIGEDAFRSCSKLAHFDFPNDTITIGSSAFRDDVQLNHVILAEKTWKLGAKIQLWKIFTSRLP